MKITLLSTYDTYGGAGIAATRLLSALQKQGTEAQMLVHQQTGAQAGIVGLDSSFIQKKLAFSRFALERVLFLPYEKSKAQRFAFSMANIGIDISQHPIVQTADVLHLHWINFGFLSLDSLKKLFALNKPIVWTLHDEWAFTGGCHYSGECINYQALCGNCKFLKKPSVYDLSNRVLSQKIEVFNDAPITVVACSEWLANKARKSTIFGKSPVLSIPNPIDTEAFKPMNQAVARQALNLPLDKPLILFAAMNVQDERKGFRYLKEALTILKNQLPFAEIQPELVILGKNGATNLHDFPFKVLSLGSISGIEKMAQVYNAASVLVIPSLEDNLPNTVMESLACGTPVVSFQTGGIPEMVSHQHNGFIATQQSADELAKGIAWTLYQADYELLSYNARQKVMQNYRQEIVSKQYLDVYQNAVVN